MRPLHLLLPRLTLLGTCLFSGQRLVASTVYWVPAAEEFNTGTVPEHPPGKHAAKRESTITSPEPSTEQSIVVRLFKSMGTRPSTANPLKDLKDKVNLSSQEYFLQLSSLQRETTARPTRANALTRTLADSTRETAVYELTQDMGIYGLLKDGIGFNLNLSALFTSPAGVTAKPLRYGLVLDRIDAGQKGADQAATSVDWDSRGQAKPIWKIGPLEPSTTYSGAQPEMHDAKKSLWEAPRPDFRLSAAPGSVPGAVESGTVTPGTKLQLTQQQSYYKLEYLTDQYLKKIDVSHIYTLPLHENLKAQQSYDEKHTVRRSSLLNVLVNKNRPILNLNYLNQENRYTADFLLAGPNRELVATIDTPKGYNLGHLGNSAGERFEVKYSLGF